MKLKNVNLALFILAGLLCLSLAFFVTAEQNSNGTKNIFLDSDQDGLTDSEEKAYGTNPQNPDTDGDSYSDGAEVRAGYNPLLKAPGDKISPDSNKKNKTLNINSSFEDDQNLTEEMAQKISILLDQSSTEGEVININDIQSILDSITNEGGFEEELPKISEDDIKIKKQKYSKLSKKKAQEKEKEDMLDYSVAVLYIFTSNSPEPLTSSTDVISVINKTTQQILSSLGTGNSKHLDDLEESGNKIYEQLKEVEVPENMVDIQIKALQYALYAQNLKSLLQQDSSDPLANLVNYSKIGSFVASLGSFYDEIENKMEDYGIEPDELKDELEDQGINGNIFINT